MARQLKYQLDKSFSSLEKKSNGFKLPLEDFSHVVGQTAAIRFFDENSKSDFEAMNEILGNRQIRNWMDDTNKLTWRDYREWAGTHTARSFLFSVHDSRLPKVSQIKKVKGFVNIYSEKGEKHRVRRMAKLNILKDIEDKHFLEISMALRPPKRGKLQSSGLMSSALRQACLQVRAWLNYPQDTDLIIFAFIDPENVSSARAVKASGFIKKGKAKYDSTSVKESDVYILSWRNLRKIIKDKMDLTLRNKMKVIMEAQKTDSHCGPAVTKALLGFHNIHFTQDEIVNAARAKSTLMRYGMNPQQIALAVKKLNPDMKFWYKQKATFSDLVELIHNYKLPVAVNWQGLFYNSPKFEKIKSLKNAEYGHYSIAIDINVKKDEIMIDDPYPEYFNTPRVFSCEWFKKRWWDKDVLINKNAERKIILTKQLIFVITPKDFALPEKIGLHEMNEFNNLNTSNR